MISGTSKIWSKSGPVDLLIITKNASKNTRSYGNILENIIFVNMGLKKIENFRKTNVCPRYHEGPRTQDTREAPGPGTEKHQDPGHPRPEIAATLGGSGAIFTLNFKL